MKILLFCPTYRKPDKSLAMFPQTRQSIDALDRSGHDVTEWISVDEIPNKKDNVISQYRKAWKRAIAENFDAILTVEHDMIVPADALQKLAETDADVVYGVYLFRESGTLSALRRCDTPCLDQPLNIFPDEIRKAVKQGVYPVSGTGFGCTLIRRRVFENIPLRKPQGGNFPDLPLSQDCLTAGYTQMARFDVRCGHICTNGTVLWPSLDDYHWMPSICTIMPKQPFIGNVMGKSVRFVPGVEQDIPTDAARDFARANFVEIVRIGEDILL